MKKHVQYFSSIDRQVSLVFFSTAPYQGVPDVRSWSGFLHDARVSAVAHAVWVFESFQLVSALQYMEQSSHLLASAPAWRECLWFVLGAVCFIPFHETDVIVCTGINCLSFKCFRYCWSKLHLIYFEYHASFGVSQKTRLARLHDAVRQSCMSLRTFFFIEALSVLATKQLVDPIFE